jgi:hypothetical protein
LEFIFKMGELAKLAAASVGFGEAGVSFYKIPFIAVALLEAYQNARSP